MAQNKAASTGFFFLSEPSKLIYNKEIHIDCNCFFPCLILALVTLRHGISTLCDYLLAVHSPCTPLLSFIHQQHGNGHSFILIMEILIPSHIYYLDVHYSTVLCPFIIIHLLGRKNGEKPHHFATPSIQLVTGIRVFCSVTLIPAPMPYTYRF